MGFLMSIAIIPDADQLYRAALGTGIYVPLLFWVWYVPKGIVLGTIWLAKRTPVWIATLFRFARWWFCLSSTPTFDCSVWWTQQLAQR